MEISDTQSILSSSILRTRDVSGFRLSENLYSAKTKLPTHVHEQAQLWIALKGHCNEIYGGKLREHETLAVGFLPSDEIHTLHFPFVGMRSFGIAIAPQWLERMREYSLSLDYSVHSPRGLLAGLFIKLYKEFRQIDEASPLAIEGLALEMLAEVSRRKVKVSDRKPPRWLAQALELLREQFSEHLTIAYLATSVGVHPVHLAREFRKFYRCTIGEYIRQLRIEHACRELCMSDASLATIAAGAGFSDQSHFSRTFKRLVGMTPAEYRAAFSSR
jgi:AraC family transcriptional regulator